jgi:hypothetical protein
MKDSKLVREDSWGFQVGLKAYYGPWKTRLYPSWHAPKTDTPFTHPLLLRRPRTCY